MKKVKYPNLDDYDLSAYEELKGDILYRINGGMTEADQYAMQQADAHHDEEKKKEILEKYEKKEETPVTTTPTNTNPPAAPKTNSQATTPAATTEPTQPPVDAGSSTTKTSTKKTITTTGGSTSTPSSNTTTNTNNNTTAAGGRTTTTSNNSTGQIKVDSHDPSRILTNLDDPNSLKGAAKLLYDANLGYRVTAYGENSSIVMNFNSYSEINEYLSKMEGNNSLLAKEPAVKQYVMNVAVNPDNYSMEAYQRKALIPYKGDKNETLTHSLYVITDKTSGERATLSFNGSFSLGVISKGAWGLNTETDLKGLKSFTEGNNSYSMSLLTNSNSIDVQKTASNIVKSINSDISYMAIDHVWDWNNWENCNTALYNTISIKNSNK